MKRLPLSGELPLRRRAEIQILQGGPVAIHLAVA